MSVYLIADIKVTDGAWVPDYATNVHKIIERHGGQVRCDRREGRGACFVVTFKSGRLPV